MTSALPRRLIQLLDFLIGWRIRRPEKPGAIPLEVSLEMTNLCNFKCTFCPQCSPQHIERAGGRSTLSIANAEKILINIRSLGYWDTRIHWTLDGEPFVNKSFPAICRLAAELGFLNQHFASNGMLCTPTHAATLPRNVRFSLTVDFCAEQDFFERYRGTTGSWRGILENIIVITNDPALAHINYVITDIMSYQKTDALTLRKYHSALKALFPPTPRIRFMTKTFNNSTGFIPTTFIKKGYHLCPYPWSSLMIASNGDVVACCRDLEHKTVMGNALERPLREIWVGEGYARLRRNLRRKQPEQNEACRQCDLPWDREKNSLHNIIKVIGNRLQFGR
jgi:radical SAM protein with 4Fe4S-binding SPASM domain